MSVRHYEFFPDYEGAETRHHSGGNILVAGSEEGKEWYRALSAPGVESDREKALLRAIADQYRH